MKNLLPKAVTTIGAATLSVSLLLGMAGIGTAADNTVQNGIPTTLSQADRDALGNPNAWTGSITLSIDPADLARLKAIGFDPNLGESTDITNDYNKWSDDGGQVMGNQILLKPKLDVPTFKANSPYASKIDVETPLISPDGNKYAVGLSLKDDDFFSGETNITTKEFQTKPALEEGQFTSGGVGQFGAAGNQPVYGTDAYAGNIFANPVTDNHLGGVPGDKPNTTGYDQTSGGSILLETDYASPYLDDAKDSQELSLGGGQRVISGSTRTDIVTNKGQLGFWLQPMASGKLTDGSDQIGSIAVGAPVWITVDSTLQKMRSSFTKENPYIASDGSKVWYERADFRNGTQNVGDLASIRQYGYDFYDAGVPLVATDAGVLKQSKGSPFAGSFGGANLATNPEADGNFIFVTSYDSPYMSASESLTAVANDVSAQEAEVATAKANLDAANASLSTANANLAKAQADLDEAKAAGKTGSDLEPYESAVSTASEVVSEVESEVGTYTLNLTDAQAALDAAKAAPATNYKLTYTKPSLNNGADTNKVWTQDGKTPLAVGTTWTASEGAYEATFTVEFNVNGVLVIDAKLNTAGTVAPRIQPSGYPTIGTGAFLGGVAEVYQAPGYEMMHVPGDVPPVTTIIPTPTPTDTPTPTPTDTFTSITDEGDEPGSSISDEGSEDEMAITAAEGAQPATLPQTGMPEGAFTLIGGLGILGALMLSIGGWVTLKSRRLAKAQAE
jgi:hypothetical protein